MTIDRHTLALISIIGSSLDVLGAMYLAYDLLGGEHGPLRTLSRAVTYGAVLGTGYGLCLGPLFGLATGATHGITLALELSRASRHRSSSGAWFESAMSAIRGAGFGLGFAHLYGGRCGLFIGAVSWLGQTVAYRFGMSPSVDYGPAARLRLTRRQLVGALNRTVGYTATGYLGALAWVSVPGALSVGLHTGLTIGVVTALASTSISYVEWTADHVAERVMGVFGIALILIGFGLQSVQYWITLMDVTVR